MRILGFGKNCTTGIRISGIVVIYLTNTNSSTYGKKLHKNWNSASENYISGRPIVMLKKIVYSNIIQVLSMFLQKLTLSRFYTNFILNSPG